MANDSGTREADDAANDLALQPFPPGDLIRLARGPLVVDVAPAAGGRIAQIRYEDIEWLAGYEANAQMIGWGCYPMVPWAGRIRRGRFAFEGVEYRLPATLGAHAIHGVGFALPWQVDEATPHHIDLSLTLPRDERWPFGGIARQRIELHEDSLRCRLSVEAERAMPRPVLGWHPWFPKPARMGFAPEAIYPQDEEGIAVAPVTAPTPSPWDDCFINRKPVTLVRDGQSIRLTSDCIHWVIYDRPANTTCVEPQTGPPDAFNLQPATLQPGASADALFVIDWL